MLDQRLSHRTGNHHLKYLAYPNCKRSIVTSNEQLRGSQRICRDCKRGKTSLRAIASPPTPSQTEKEGWTSLAGHSFSIEDSIPSHQHHSLSLPQPQQSPEGSSYPNSNPIDNADANPFGNESHAQPNMATESTRPLTFTELLAVDIDKLTRTAKRRMEAHLSAEEKNELRKARIKAKMKGRLPWNTGRPHPEETLQKIRERTKKAMESETTRDKLRVNHYPKWQTDQTKAKISKALRERYAAERQVVQELLLDPSGKAMSSVLECFHGLKDGKPVRPSSVQNFAALMPPGILNKERLSESATSRLLAKHFPEGRLRNIITAAERVLARVQAESSGDEEAISNFQEAVSDASPIIEPKQDKKAEKQAVKRSQAHRQAIADGVRRKWQDPEYRLKQSLSIERVQRLREKMNKELSKRDSKRKTIQGSSKVEEAVEEASKVDAEEETKLEAEEKSAEELSKIDIVSNEAVSEPAKKPKKEKAKAPSQKKPKAEKTTKTTKTAKSSTEQISSAILDKIKKQEMEIVRKQAQRRAKLDNAKMLVSELEDVLSVLPSEAELGPADKDLKTSIVEAIQLLVQAKSRVKALEEPFSSELANQNQANQQTESEEWLQSAMFVLNMDNTPEK